jgi:membrane fusion protein (multidrug efflux system)
MNKPLSAAEIETAVPALAQPKPAKAMRLRKKLFAGLAGGVLLIAGGAWAYNATIASNRVETDNAYVAADAAQVTALAAGPVGQVRVVDTQAVKQGDVLVVLDDTDRRLELAQAQSALGQAERKVQGYQANDTALGGQVAAKQADLERARAELDRARSQYDRRAPLASAGWVSGEEMTTTKSALAAAEAAVSQAEANLRAAQGSRQANSVLIADAAPAQNPEVTAARSRVEQARVNLERTVVRAPVDGVVARRSVQVGQMVQPGSPLMSVVPVQQAYVNANFKEVQLRKVRVGQPVELQSDLYGGKVVYQGKVVGLSGGTGSAFAVIPAQNATGNWIKVVQRLPVRIAIDPADLAAHPLKVGLSMKAVIHLDR